MDIYEVLLHGEPMTIQLSAGDAERLGVAPRHATEEAGKDSKPRGK